MLNVSVGFHIRLDHHLRELIKVKRDIVGCIKSIRAIDEYTESHHSAEHATDRDVRYSLF